MLHEVPILGHHVAHGANKALLDLDSVDAGVETPVSAHRITRRGSVVSRACQYLDHRLGVSKGALDLGRVREVVRDEPRPIFLQAVEEVAGVQRRRWGLPDAHQR